MIQSKMKELAWRHHFPIIRIWKFFRHSREANSLVNGPMWPKFEPRLRFYACPHYLQVQKGSDQKQPRKGGDIVFPIISQWGLSVAMETRVLIQSAPKLYAAFPPPQ